MAGQNITIKLEGSEIDNMHVRLNELIQQLQFVRAALKQTERLVTGKDENLLYYKVIDLSHSSPVTVVLEATPIKQEIKKDIAFRTVNSFFRNLNWIQKKSQVPSRVDLQALEAYRDLGSLLNKNVTNVQIINSHRVFDINEQFTEKVVDIIGPDEIIEGSMSGMLEWLNLHNTHTFHIYPEVGPKKLNCNFHKDLRSTVISAIDKHVRVYGELRYKKRDKYPYAINVKEIEILPDENELPTLASLRGISVNQTGMDANALVRWLRDG
jgi:tetrahydromethanopterin S-methyltransferase subunit G